MRLKPVEYHPGARLDVITAFDWYELHEAGLGVRFQKELATAEKFVRHNPLLGQPHRFETRKRPFKVFPYNLIYSDEPDLILVLAVAHYSRVSNYWYQRRTH